MRGRLPNKYNLQAQDRSYLSELADNGQLIQRIAMRARVLLALDRGERVVEIMRWFGLSRTKIWELWQRYQQRGVDAVFDEERSGRPPVFSPAGENPDRADCLY